MGNSTSGIHGDYVIARARRHAGGSTSDCSHYGMRLEHATPSVRDCVARKAVLEKIDRALGNVFPNVAVKKDGEHPTTEHEEALHLKEALVDILPSKKYLYDNTLFLCSQSVVEITPCICRLKSLRIVQGCCNFMSQLPTQICFLKNLRSLILSNNQIHSLPDDIGECTRLKEINLSNNYLRSLPASFSKLSWLGALNIAENRFSSIPICIASLNSLRYLNVERNYIKAVPIEVLRLKGLTKLRSYGNPFVFVENIDSTTEIASLMELCARKVFHMGRPLGCAEVLSSFVRVAKKCSFCTGPYYERAYEYTDVQTTIFGTIPVYYRLCSRHFGTKKEKIEQTLNSKNSL